jgi:S1-C subfamily serine protease
MYVITNAHVVKGCSKVIIKGAVPERVVSVRVLDDEHDLALLQTDQPPQQFAPLRFNIDELRVGDKVFVIGYPGVAGARGEYKVAQAEVLNLAGNVSGNPGQFYITDVVEHGNSGGPVFDGSGNVIGVVVAKSVLTTINKATQQKIAEQRVGVAITLATLENFLYTHGVYTELSGSGLLYADDYIEEHAKDYIVNVQCRTPTSRPLDATGQP